MDYQRSITVDLPYTEAVTRTREALAEQGFGILTEIDLAGTLKKKLDVDVPAQVILGACNPPLAHRALEAEPDLGVLLPCNVVVYRRDGETTISAVDAERMLSIVGNEAVEPIAADVRRRLASVVARAVA
jgi:uncharacterized protein (DUF302 family)